MVKKLKNEVAETQKLMRMVPAWILVMFVLSSVCMNLFANKSINLPVSWLALDCGIIFAWAPFLSMDIIVKHFGPKASIRLTFVSIIVNIIVSIMFFLGAAIPGSWGESFNYAEANIVNASLNSTFRGNWYVLFGSTLAFAISGIVNALVNASIGKLLRKKDNFSTFAARSYISTFIAQFVDNLVFSLVVSQVLFGWAMVQCITCSLTGAVCELLMEVVFSPLGWKVSKGWKKLGIGSQELSSQAA